MTRSLAADETSRVASVSVQVVRFARQLNSLRAQAQAKHRHGVEWSSYVLLFHLVRAGALRSSALAESVCADPSTVSRQTALLVDLGLVERRPDPDDGRAVQLVATQRGRELYEQMRRDRDAVFESVLQDWSEQDVAALTDLLDRFTTDIERHRALTTRPTSPQTDPQTSQENA